jgi:hypothetical protein
LVGVAATFGKLWHTRACKTAADFAAAFKNDDITTVLFSDIHKLLGGCNSILTKDLIEQLHNMEDRPYANDWRGPDDTERPRALNDQALSDFLRPYNIRSKTIWPDGPRTPDKKSGKGYYRRDFDSVWASHAVTPSQPNNSNSLRPEKHVKSPGTSPAQVDEMEFGQ